MYLKVQWFLDLYNSLYLCTMNYKYIYYTMYNELFINIFNYHCIIIDI